MKEVTVRVLGGLPITVEFTVQGADPECGIMSAGVDDWKIVAVADRYRKSGFSWIEKRLTKTDESAIIDACNKRIGEMEDGYDDSDYYGYD